MELRWSETAAKDLQGILQFLAQTSSEVALKLIGRIEEAEEALLRFPYMGRSLAYLGYPSDHKLVMPPYVLYYTVQEEQIIVLRFLDGRRIVAEYPNPLG